MIINKVYLSGNLHGDERVGPNVVLELAQVLIDNYGENELITKLIDNTLIVMTPMTNAYGYYNSIRVIILYWI